LRTYKVNAIVLRRANVGETDKILTLFSRERGKIPAIAKGARKPISRIAGAAELLTFGKFAMAVGRNLDVVTQVDVRDSFPDIRRDMRKIAHATYLLELADQLTQEHEANPDLFDLLLSALYVLQNGGNAEVLSRGFEIKAMDILGYRPQLDGCVRCGKAAIGQIINFSPSAGGIICAACGPLPQDATGITRAVRTAMKRFLETEPPDWKGLRFAKGIGAQLSNVMKWYIRYRTERDLRSEQFIRVIQTGAKDEELPSGKDI